MGEKVPNTTALSSPSDVPTYDARDLMKGGIIARIVLNQQEYFLRITKAGKLILTK